MIELTYTDLFGLCVVLLLLGGTTAVYGLHFLAWTDQRRAARRFRDLDVPEQRTRDVHVHAAAIDLDSPTQRELRRAQARADTIRDRRRPGGVVPPPRLCDPPGGMEDRVVERLHSLGEDLRAADPYSSSSNPTTEENPDGR